MTPLHSTHLQMVTPLSDIEKSELSYLRELQANRHRWFSQEEFERLNELARRDWGNPRGPHDVADMTDATPMPFGRYKDKRMDAVPAVYLLWLLDHGCTHDGVKRYILNNKVALDREAANIRRE